MNAQDMLEVGNLEDYAADEAHFGLWVVTSSPLILGFDMHVYVVSM